MGLHSINTIWKKRLELEDLHDSTVLVVSHRPIIGGLVAHSNRADIKTTVNDPKLTESGYRVFEYDGENLTLIR